MIRIPNFLSEQERNALYNAICIEKGAFYAPGVSESETSITKFLSWDSYKNEHTKAPLTSKASMSLAARIMENLPLLFKSLDVEPFDVSEIPVNFVSGLNGHYGDPHADSIDGRYKISLLYYFHKVPKMFSGGDLEFYATDD